MKKLLFAGLVLCAIGFGLWVLLVSSTPNHDGDYYVALSLGSPFLVPLRHVKTLSLDVPTFGDGHCMAAYTVTAEDFERLLEAQPRRAEPGTGDPSTLGRHFPSVWPGAPSDFETYHLDLSDDDFAQMVVSTDHTRIILMVRVLP